jgi:hypothetical protein
MNRWLLLLLLVLAANTAGCTAQQFNTLYRAQGTAPHDPPQGRQLFEQFPAWDDAAHRTCGAHLPRDQMKPGMTRWC